MAEAMTGMTPGSGMRVLAIGLGNGSMTPDAVGPHTLRRLSATRHLREYDEALFVSLGCCELAALSPGVLGQTGMESGELVKMAAELTRPHLIVAVDALAARSCERLASMIQLSDGGISPGAGIGNHRMPLTRETMGCPVMGVGVPTVVDSSTLVLDALEKAGVDAESLSPDLAEVLERGRSFFVSPKDCDEVVSLTCRLLAKALDEAFGVGEL
jgi:spore protease